MLRALYSAAAGMQSQQMKLDVISNNLANVNTTGFKKAKIEFQELLYQTTRAAGAEQGAGNEVPTGIQIGNGSTPVATNDNWGGTPELRLAFADAGAFALPSDSADAALVLSLSPGAYSVQVTSAGVANASGVALVEVYEVP